MIVAACTPSSETPAVVLPKLSDAPAAPVARVEPVSDVYFGETITDNYRWMENPKDPDWLPFLENQNKHTRGVIDAIPGRDKLLARIKEVTGYIVATNRVQEEATICSSNSVPPAPKASSCSCARRGQTAFLSIPPP